MADTCRTAAPLVTVYITNHNYGRFLAQAIESVFAQTMTEFELLVIDDGSTDDSRSVIERYSGDPRVRVIYQERRGISVSNNVALQHGRGQYILRLDADDWLAPDALRQLAAALDESPDVALVFPDYYWVDIDGHILSRERRHDFSTVTMLDQPAHGACTMVRREVLLEAGGYDEEFNCQDGYDLWLKVIGRYRVANVNQPLFHYRQHGTNGTRSEDRLLLTRAAMKAKLVAARGTRLSGIALIPVRGMHHAHGEAALKTLGGVMVLQRLVKAAIEAKAITGVVVTSPDPAVERIVRTLPWDAKAVHFVPRGPELARLNVPLAATVGVVLTDARVRQAEPEFVATLSPTCPFMSARALDEAVNNLVLFGADSAIGVRPETALLFRHSGHGMVPLDGWDSGTRREREALWRNSGALYVTKVIAGSDGALRVGADRRTERVTHVVLTRREAFSLDSAFEWHLAEHLCNVPYISTSDSGVTRHL
jgi:CMP-N-acetylneuraminic acid synthetase